MLTELRHLPAPAKLNLFLHVTGRRADGYHLLETVFQLIDLSDSVHLQRLDDSRIELIAPLAGVAPEDDLTVRAARRLAAASGCALGVRIALDKRIPMGGGLGGGSSDAATVLLGLNRLWGLIGRAAGLPNSRSGWAPMSRSSFVATMPTPPASANACARWHCRRGCSWWSRLAWPCLPQASSRPPN
jgi:hypothetical protein